MSKKTSKLLEELKKCADFRAFYEENWDEMATSSLSQLLNDLMEEKGLKKSQVIKNSELAEVYAYQIFSGLRRPDRKKLLALAVGMKLSLPEVQKLLKCASYPQLYAKIPFDCIVLYGISKKMSVLEINGMLFEYGEETLGGE